MRIFGFIAVLFFSISSLFAQSLQFSYPRGEKGSPALVVGLNVSTFGGKISVPSIYVANIGTKRLVSVQLAWVVNAADGQVLSKPHVGSFSQVSIAPEQIQEVTLMPNASPDFHAEGLDSLSGRLVVGIESAVSEDGSQWAYGVAKSGRFIEQFDPDAAKRIDPALKRLNENLRLRIGQAPRRCAAPAVASVAKPGGNAGLLAGVVSAIQNIQNWIRPVVAHAQDKTCYSLVCNPGGSTTNCFTLSACLGGITDCVLGAPCSSQILGTVPIPCNSVPPDCGGGQ